MCMFMCASIYVGIRTIISYVCIERSTLLKLILIIILLTCLLIGLITHTFTLSLVTSFCAGAKAHLSKTYLPTLSSHYLHTCLTLDILTSTYTYTRTHTYIYNHRLVCTCLVYMTTNVYVDYYF